MKFFYALSICTFFLTAQLTAQGGVLDPTFGSGGIVTNVLPDEDSRIEALALQDDGKPVVAGFYGNNLLVGRYNTDGIWDTSFDGDGWLALSIGSIAKAYHVMIQPDGKILAMGYSRSGNTESLTLVRLDTDGTLDSSFGTDGISTLAVSGSSFGEDEIYDAILLDDGSIVIGGKSYNGQHDDFIIARFLADGSPDDSFGTNGATTTSTDGFRFDVAQAIVRQADGKYVLGGSIGSNMGLIRYDAAGNVDVSFGTNGIVELELEGDFNFGANDLVILPDGKLIAGGGAFNNDELDNNFALVRFNPDGSLDETFANNGISIIQRSSNESIQSLILQDNGLILAAGSTGGFNAAFAMTRFLSNGSQDNSFGTNGWAITNPSGGFDGINAIAQLPNGDIIAGGYAQDSGSQYNLALAKYNSSFMVNTQDINALSQLSLYPNPVQQHFKLAFSLEQTVTARLALLDASGRLLTVLQTTTEWNPGAHRLEMEVPPHWPAGTYYLVFAGPDGQNVVPFQKVN